MAGEPGYLRWTPAEWLKVAAHAIPHIDKGVPHSKALMRAQRSALSKKRHRDEESLRKLVWSDSTKKYLDQARALPLEQRDEIAPPPPPRKMPPPRKKLDEGRVYANGTIRWTTREKARVARQVDDWIASGDTRALARLIIEAQEIVIEPDRRRPVKSIGQGAVGGDKSHNALLMAEGRLNRWIVEEEAKSAAAPAVADVVAEAEPIAEAEAAEAEASEAAAEPAPQAPESGSSFMPAQGTIDWMAKAREHYDKPKPRASTEAAQAFANAMMGALDGLLAAHTETILSEVVAKMNANAAQTAAAIAAQIERGMRETVHKIVEAELGGPVSPPSAGDAPAPKSAEAQAQPEPQPQPQPEVAKAPIIKVDVVGFLNHVTPDFERRVRENFNGSTDLRFVGEDHKSSYAPHRGRHVVMAAERLPHAITKKIRASGVKPIIVKATVGHVVQAIEEIHRANGVHI